MATFLVFNKDRSARKQPVLAAQCEDQRHAVAVFTSRSRAEHYLHQCDLAFNHQVSEVSAIELVEILLVADEHGVALLAVNPILQECPAGISGKVLRVEDKLAEFATALATDVADRSMGIHSRKERS